MPRVKQAEVSRYRVVEDQEGRRVLVDFAWLDQQVQPPLPGMSSAPDRLFRTFAALDWQSEPAIVRFANQYGYLGSDCAFVRVPVEQAGCWSRGRPKTRLLPVVPPGEEPRPGVKYRTTRLKVKGYIAVGERLTHWQNEILRMRWAVELLDYLNPGGLRADTAGLSSLIRWSEGGDRVVYEKNGPPLHHSELIAHKCTDVEVFGQLQPGTYVQPARVLLQRWVNEKLREHVAPRLLWEPGWKRLVYVEQANTMLGWMWRRLAEEISNPGGSRVQVCEICGQPFDCKRRGRAKYCSATCKKRAFRRLKKETA